MSHRVTLNRLRYARRSAAPNRTATTFGTLRHSLRYRYSPQAPRGATNSPATQQGGTDDEFESAIIRAEHPAACTRIERRSRRPALPGVPPLDTPEGRPIAPGPPERRALARFGGRADLRRVRMSDPAPIDQLPPAALDRGMRVRRARGTPTGLENPTTPDKIGRLCVCSETELRVPAAPERGEKKLSTGRKRRGKARMGRLGQISGCRMRGSRWPPVLRAAKRTA